jgi:hypothetical protein
MTTVILTTGSTWTVPSGMGAGTIINVECWGAGAGGSASSSYGAGGAGGAYSDTPFYVLSPHDLTNGIAYTIGQGSAGTGAANPTVGGTTTFGNNVNSIQCNTNIAAALGTPGTLPGDGYNYLSYYNPGSLSTAVTGFGNLSNGIPYCNFRMFGTASGSNNILMGYQCVNVTASVPWVLSGQMAMVAGSLTNISGVQMSFDAYNGGTAVQYGLISQAVTLTSTLTSYYASATTPATTNNGTAYINLNYNAGPIDITVQLAGWQFEQGTTPTFLRFTPCYTAAQGGGAPTGTTGGLGSVAATTANYNGYNYAGGNGANYNANGAGGGGSGGPDGVGANGTTAGVGGQGDGASGGSGGLVSSSSPGNAGAASTTGGGGGGGLKTVSGNGGAGALPGGGGGGSEVGGTGGAGANGQIRLTYSQTFPYVSRVNRNFLLRR